MAQKNESRTYIIALLLTWLLGCLFQYFFCCNSKEAEAVAVQQPAKVGHTPTPTSHPFSVKGDSLFVNISGEDNFNFFANKETPVTPIMESLKSNTEKLTRHLADNENRQLLITGLYHPNENNSSIFPNLGLARANQIKNYLTNNGANPHQIRIAGEEYPLAVSNQDNKYLGMADFSVEELDDTRLKNRNAEMLKLAEEIKSNPIILYFNTGDAEIKLNSEQRNALFNIVRYLNFDDEAKVSVTGHTDNTGDYDANINLGKERASFAVDYLVKKGLEQQRFKLASVGQSQPIADNNTDEGRAKNRRVVINIIDGK